MNLKIFSIGGYSSWAYYKPARILFDAGEGVATHLRNEVFGPSRIFISHWHGDHVNGLAQFFATRGAAKGDKRKKITIYYDNSNSYALRYVELLGFVTRNLYPIEWVGIENGSIIEIDNRRFVEVFETKHSRRFTSFGFRVMEKRTRLKNGVDPSEAKKLVAAGYEVNEPYNGNLFTYTLDSFHFDKEKVKGAQHWVADSTFLNPKDKNENSHMTMRDVLNISSQMNVRNVYLAHVSSRYSNRDIVNATKDLKLHTKVFPVLHGRVNKF